LDGLGKEKGKTVKKKVESIGKKGPEGHWTKYKRWKVTFKLERVVSVSMYSVDRNIQHFLSPTR
jgi:hypothetical protein